MTDHRDAEIDALRREVRRLKEIIAKVNEQIERHDNNQLTKESK